jgi:GxxExxY protein
VHPENRLELDRISGAIIGCAIRVHREIGPGLLESVYEACLGFELESAGLAVERQKAVGIQYRGHTLECAYRLDLLVNRAVVVEVKSIESLHGLHTAQLLTYLRLTGCPLGLLINFNTPLLRDGIRRVIL